MGIGLGLWLGLGLGFELGLGLWLGLGLGLGLASNLRICTTTFLNVVSQCNCNFSINHSDN